MHLLLTRTRSKQSDCSMSSRAVDTHCMNYEIDYILTGMSHERERYQILCR